MFGASVSEVYNIIRCQFDLKIEVIADGYLVAALSKEVCSSCWKQGGEGHTKVSFSGEFIDRCSSNGGPHIKGCEMIHSVGIEWTAAQPLALSSAV